MSRSWLRLVIAVGALVLGWLLRSVTVPLLGAYLLCLLSVPIKTSLQTRMGSTLAVFLCLALLVLVPLVLLLPTLLEVNDFAGLLPTQDQAGEFVAKFQGNLSDLRQKLPPSVAEHLSFDAETLKGFASSAAQHLAGVGGAIAGFLGGFFGIVGILVLMPIFVFFLLQGAPWEPKLRGEMPPEWRASYDRVVPRIIDIMRRYTRARVLVAMCKGLIWFGLLLVGGVPGSYTLALLAGGMSLLPVFGPLLAFLGVALVSFVNTGLSGLLFSLAAYAVAEAVEGYVLMPRLVGRGLGLGDFAVILAVMCGSALAGIFGMLVAIPLVAIAKVLYDEFARPIMGTREA